MTVEYTYKIILIGASAVGKTSLMYRYVKDQFGDFKATLGTDFMIKELTVDGHNAKLTIWDIGGHERFKSLRKSYYVNTKGALLLYDLTREDTFKELEQWHSEMVEILKQEVPFVLIGNKVDLINETNRKIDVNLAKQFAVTRDSIYIETSAKTGVNVEQAFKELTRRMIKRYDDIIRVPD